MSISWAPAPPALHGLLTGAKVRGTLIRFRQFDADHQYAPVTVSSPRACSLTPAGTVPDAVHQLSACCWTVSVAPLLSVTVSVGEGTSSGGRPASVRSQLIPSIGMATSEQGTVSEQPREAFSLAVKMSNFALPVPFAAVAAHVSLLGKVSWLAAESEAASAGSGNAGQVF